MSEPYGMKTRIATPFDQAIELVTQALADEGFGILTEIDVKATLKKKLDADFRPYRILGACNPPLARQALTTELDIGLLLPCNVIVYDDEGGTVVSIADPGAMVDLTGNPALKEVADQARARLGRVLETVSRGGSRDD